MADESVKRIIELSMNATPAISEAAKFDKAMKDNTQSVDGLQSGLSEMIEMGTKAFQVLAVADLARQFVSNMKDMIDEMDQLGKSAQVVGVNVEKLQELQYGLKLGAGLDDGAATAALQRFGDKLADVNNKTSDAARVMREMGITANDTVETAMNKLADAFAAAPDGINKTAIATEIFGRNLAQKMIPYLNGGSQGIADMSKELHELGGVYTEDAVKKSAEFNDNLTKLAQSSKELGMSITASLLPELVATTKAMVDSIKAGTVMKDLWREIKDESKRQFDQQFWNAFDQKSKDQTKAAEQRISDYQKLNAGYADAVAKMKVQVDPLPAAHVVTEKVKAAGAAAAQAKSDFEGWMDSMLKAGQADKDLPDKIAWLESHLKGLADAGQAGSEAWKKWNAELLKLRPDAIASELLKLADAAQKLDEATSDKMLKALEDRLVEIQKNGPAATSEVKLLHAEILKIKADSGDALAIFTKQLEATRAEAAKNAEQWEVINQQFADNQITLTEYSELASKVLPKVSTSAKEAASDVNDLAKAVNDASAKFVTDFVDDLIDGFGKVHASFGDMVTDMLKQLAKLMVQLELAAAMKTLNSSGGLASLFSGGAATGAAFDNHGIEFMASGGILNSPTFFNNAGRLAVAGEAGPEAVVPLQRNSSGDLGVAASPVTININNETPAQVDTATKDNADGSRQIDIYITQKVKSMMSDGTMDKTMRNTYGIGRRPAAG